VHCTWSENQWRHVAFSDESIFKIFNSKGRQYVWRFDGQALDSRYTKKTVKHGGGSVAVWGVITADGVGPLTRISGVLTKEKYVKILSDALPDYLPTLSIPQSELIYQHNNDPKHTSKMATEWMASNSIPVLPWPLYSPDMNLIEHVWALLERRVRRCTILPCNSTQLWEALKEEWEGIEAATISNLYASMVNRVDELVKHKGGNTHY
jgi:hypothetical protein